MMHMGHKLVTGHSQPLSIGYSLASYACRLSHDSECMEMKAGNSSYSMSPCIVTPVYMHNVCVVRCVRGNVSQVR